jgi:hypothetical protein
MTKNWHYQDIPISNYSVTHEVNPINGEIKVITNIMGKIQEEIIQSKSDQIQNALVSLGWTPPGYKCKYCRD